MSSLLRANPGKPVGCKVTGLKRKGFSYGHRAAKDAKSLVCCVRSSSLVVALQKKLADEIEDLRVRLTELAYLGTCERLIKLILELGEKYGRRSNHGLVMDLKLTERDLAEMLGNTRVWVCRQMGILRQKGLITYKRGVLVILDEARLRQLAPPCKRNRIFPFWSTLDEMCKVIYSASVN